MTVPHVYIALSEVMGKLAKAGISKAQKNVQQNYAFRGIDDVYNALAGYLSEAKLLMLPRVLSREQTEQASRNGGVLFKVVLDVEFDFVSAVDGSKHVIKTFGEAMDSADKATNKAQSAAFKYAAIQSFCIPTEGDNDADGTTHDVKAKEKPQAKPVVHTVSAKELETADKQPVVLKPAPVTQEELNQLTALAKGNGWVDADIRTYIKSLPGGKLSRAYLPQATEHFATKKEQ